jgi:hypothetical protein
MIYGPDTDGSYFVEFRKSDGESLAISVPGSDAAGPVFPGANALWAVRAGHGAGERE